MKSKKLIVINYIFFCLFFSIGPSYLTAQIENTTLNNWQQITTVEDVCKAFPQRMRQLLEEIDLDFEGMDKVKQAYESGNIITACSYLLDYYRKASTVSYLRRDCPTRSEKIDDKADTLLQNIFTFYMQTDKVPRDAMGHLDWKYHGPADDIEWAWALNRHYYINELLDAFLKTGNSAYATKIDTDLRDWIISSLPYPGIKSNTELWRGLEVSFRVKAWVRIFYGLMNCPELSAATRLLILSSIPEHAHYLKNFHSQGNWLTMEMSGLATASAGWPEFENSPSWIGYAKATMTESLKKQVYPDGVQTELTSHYHQVALNNFSLFMNICKEAKIPLPEFYNSAMEKMWNYIAYTMRPDGYGLLNNDADLDYNRVKIVAAASEYSRKDWLYIASNGEKGIRPKGQASAFFPWAGHLIMRSGFEPNAQWAFFDMGPWGTGHQHNDKLHLSISAYGRDLLVDAGRFAYRGDVAKKFRDYATGSFGHNVILIDGNGQEAGPELNTQAISNDHFKIADKFDFASGSFDRFKNIEGESKHLRAVFYVRGKFWVVVDRISTDRPRKIEVLWHWHPDCKVSIQDNNIVASQNKSGNLQIIPLGSSSWSVSLVKGQEKPKIQGWYSREYNEFKPNTASIYSTEIKNSTTFVWVLYPSEHNSHGIKARILSEDKNMVVLKVSNPKEGSWIIQVPLLNSDKASCEFLTNKK